MSADSNQGSAESAGIEQQFVVYVVDDDDSIRRALARLFRSVGLRAETFDSSAAFLASPKCDLASCLVLDVRLQGESGLAVQDELAKCGLRMPIVFMTGYGDVVMSVKAMKAGAVDFLAKPFRDQDMLDAVASALTRDSERLAAERSIASLRATYESLTPREREVMGFVVAGMMNKRIAAEMNLSEITVKVHRARVMQKMDARSVADLVRKAEALHVKPQRENATAGIRLVT